MATISADSAGNWSATGTWAGDVVPGDGDIANLNGFVVAQDIARIPASGTLLALNSPGAAGQLTVAMDVLGDCEIYATTITAGTKNPGLISMTGAAPTKTLTIGAVGNTATLTSTAGGYGYSVVYNNSTAAVVVTGNVTGGIALACHGINNNSTGAATVVGNVTGGGAGSTTSFGINNNSTGTVTVTGIVAGAGGNTGCGIYNTSTGAIIVTGAVTGGSAAMAHGIYNQSTGAITVTGGVTGGSGTSIYGIYNYVAGAIGITGSLTGGSGNQAAGIFNVTTGVVTLSSCNLINSATALAYAGIPPVWNITGKANYLLWSVKHDGAAAADTKFGPVPTTAQLLYGVVCGDVTGTLSRIKAVGEGGGLVG